ncbi:MAG: hypothetical protein M3319_15845 [Actinomycetota bacterium]|nr:hypothetical protein [Actinomycetota bacterium]
MQVRGCLDGDGELTAVAQVSDGLLALTTGQAHPAPRLQQGDTGRPSDRQCAPFDGSSRLVEFPAFQ